MFPIQIGNTLVPETPVSQSVERICASPFIESVRKQSFPDTDVPNLEIGNEEVKKPFISREARKLSCALRL